MSEFFKEYVCLNPFTYLDIQEYGAAHMCCPSWLEPDIAWDASGNRKSLADAWNSEIANDIRESVMDGTYRHCNKKVCPGLSSLAKGIVHHNFVHKNEFEPANYSTPRNILFGQDRSCNMKCPSCRDEIVTNPSQDSRLYEVNNTIQEEIENSFGNTIETILMTGSGDPIYSKLYRNYLRNFDKTKYPNLKKIVLVTNGNLLNEEMWNSFSCTDYIDTLDISIDAGTKNTYENITRLAGKWDKLLDNMKFLASLSDRPRTFMFSMVVSKFNYSEMKTMYDIVEDIFNGCTGSYKINYRQHVHWGGGAYTLEDMKMLSVFNSTHPEHSNFLEELDKIKDLPFVNHNFHHLL